VEWKLEKIPEDEFYGYVSLTEYDVFADHLQRDERFAQKLPGWQACWTSRPLPRRLRACWHLPV
jgi:hypothetical protein